MKVSGNMLAHSLAFDINGYNTKIRSSYFDFFGCELLVALINIVSGCISFLLIIKKINNICFDCSPCALICAI